VAVADLVLVQSQVRAVVERLVREREPDLVGLSVMTFQRHTAQRLIELIRALRPGVRSWWAAMIRASRRGLYPTRSGALDFIVRGEGELTFRDLLRALERGAAVTTSPGSRFAPATASSTTRRGR
jgi:radical SAM superfamily enzyme YgiQ (UPF0313 family)